MFKVFPIFYAMENCILPKNLQRRVNRLINVTQSNEEHQEQSENSKSPDEDVSREALFYLLAVLPIEIDQILCFQSLKCSYDDDITSLMTKSHPKHANRNQKKPNWLVEFCQQNRKDRVKWNSKLHHDKTRFTKKTMYEQAEDLIDIVRFPVKYSQFDAFYTTSDEIHSNILKFVSVQSRQLMISPKK